MDQLNYSLFMLFTVIPLLFSCQSKKVSRLSTEKMNAIIIDGSNNHYIWPKSTQMMKSYLEETGLFEVEVKRTDTIWLGFKYNANRPRAKEYYIQEYGLDGDTPTIVEDAFLQTGIELDFSDIDLVLLNIGENAPRFTAKTEADFVNYVKNGGGLVVVHAANNAWGDWEEYNKMIGLGGWGGRDGNSGPFVHYNDNGELIKQQDGNQCGQHGKEYEFPITARNTEHPIMRGIPEVWMHTKDEMYDFMRGPFENATILATSFSDVEENRQSWEPFPDGSGKHVPMMIAVEYGDGKIYHTPMGHFDYSQECVGFITTLQRGAEWASTGTVTQAIPDDFPSAEKSSSRTWLNN